MTGERQQCVRIYGEVERGLSLKALFHGAFRIALSANKVLYGVLSRFIDAFQQQADDIDKAELELAQNDENEKRRLKKLRAVFTEILLEFEARERILYALVALRQRGRVPLKLDFSDPTTITAFFNTNWTKVNCMGDLAKSSPAISENPMAAIQKITGTFTKYASKALIFKKTLRGETITPDEHDEMVSSPLEPDTPEDLAAEADFAKRQDNPNDRAVQKTVVQAVKDVYHEAIHELLGVCDQSLLGFTALLELYRILASGRSYAAIPTFDAGIQSLKFNADQIPEITSKPIIQLQQATEAIKRTTAMTYFYGEYMVRFGNNRGLGVGGLRAIHFPSGTSKLLKKPPTPPPVVDPPKPTVAT